LLVALLVAIGGAAGSLSRYYLGGWAYNLAGSLTFPAGTLAVNVLGCLAIGFLSGIAEVRHIMTPQTRGLLVIGFLGGFTTFSAFGNETFALVRDGHFLPALANIALQVVLGLGAVWAGYALSHTF